MDSRRLETMNIVKIYETYRTMQHIQDTTKHSNKSIQK